MSSVQEEDVHSDGVVSRNVLDEAAKQASPPHGFVDIENISSSPPSDASVLVQSPGLVREFMLRSCRFFILETSIRRRLALWVILQILIDRMIRESGYQTAVFFLRYLQKELVVNKVKLVAICLSRHIQQHQKTEDIEGNEELKREEDEAGTFEETSEVDKEEHETFEEIEEVKEDDQLEQPISEENQGNPVVKEEKSLELEESKLEKRRSEWWINTRNIMALVAIMFTTVSITGSLTPPMDVLKIKNTEIIFTIAIHFCLMVSISVLFFLFGVTATSPNIEKRMLQVANFGLWISFFALIVAYMANLWASIRYFELSICLLISTGVVFALLSSFLFSARFRSIFGLRFLKETGSDSSPYVLYDIFSVQEAQVLGVEV